MSRIPTIAMIGGLIGHALFTAAASASCGDWLVHTMSPGESTASETHQDLAADNYQVPKLPESRQCDDPSCRQTPDLPLPAAPARVVVKIKDVCCDAVAGDCGTNPLITELAFGGDSARRGFPLRIDRPPRA